MKKKSAIIKFIVVGVIALFGLLVTFLTFPVGMNDYKGFIYSIDLGLDLQGGVFAVYEAAEDTATEANALDTRMNGTTKQLTQLLSAKGYTEATVVREGSKRIRVEVPDVDDPKKIFDIIGEPAEIAFIIENGETVLKGEDVENAAAQYQSDTGKYVVVLSLNSEGAKKFADATTNHTGKTMRIDVTRGGAEPQTISNATIDEPITGGSAVISGDFSYESATELADQIMSGTFSVTLNLIECSVVSPTLGENALLSGIIGGAVAFILIVAFMCYFYRMFGVIAGATMVIYMILMFMLLGLLPWVQLTLPGIAGIILSLGMMIDGNIIIYERIKDEFREGKSILAAYYAGFKKATSAIVDGNITTMIAAVMLLIFGTGSIQGFGLTLLVGLILSMFSSLIVTRFLLKWTLVLNNSDRNIYNLKRKEGFDESKEEQYVTKKEKDINKPEGIRLVDGALPEGVMNE